jgi:hypothetical protein
LAKDKKQVPLTERWRTQTDESTKVYKADGFIYKIDKDGNMKKIGKHKDGKKIKKDKH